MRLDKTVVGGKKHTAITTRSTFSQSPLSELSNLSELGELSTFGKLSKLGELNELVELSKLNNKSEPEFIDRLSELEDGFKDVNKPSELNKIAGLWVDEIAASRVTSSVQKRVIDVAVSLVMLLAFIPLYFFAVLLIKLDSSGPAVFRQTRVGIRGIEFTLYKFRSMHVDSDAQVHKDYMKRLIRKGDDDLRGDSGCFKLECDSRITRIGKILRKTSFDELPQIINVLKGEMSLVGPRPALPYEVEMYKSWHAHRLLVKPGITGLWQVSGRSEKNFDEMVALDIGYINNWSPLIDLRILWKTVFVVIDKQGVW